MWKSQGTGFAFRVFSFGSIDDILDNIEIALALLKMRGTVYQNSEILD